MNKRLLKKGLILAFVLITFFCIKIKPFAANFAYSDFNWEEFLSQNKNYWIQGCGEDDTECVDEVLKTKEKFYKRLYSLLASYEKKGYKIDDNIIIETVFYGLTPDSFRDEGTGVSSYDGQLFQYGYTVDEGEKKEKYIGTDDNDIPGAQEYFKNEIDSLKTLMNAMIGYSQACYGVSTELPYYVTNENGSTSYVCSEDNFVPLNGKCVVKVETYSASFFDSIGLSFLSSNNNEKKCQESTTDYSGYFLGETSNKGVDQDLYWEFLENNRYFDNKFQLQKEFESVLAKTQHTKMSELTDEEYEKYEDEIVEIRKKIISNIKEILESYGEFASTPSSNFVNYVSSDTYWWPIGGSEITNNGGIEMAIGEPTSVTISSKFGSRIHPITKKNSMHYGVDIAATEGVANVIASKSGIVVYPSGGTGSCVKGDTSCGGGYGNYVVIQHSDGNYTLYAHMYTGSIRVKAGDSVMQGQVIGKVGSTGNSTGGHLHFEVRVGGNNGSSAQDPLNFISADSARTISVSSSSLIEFIHSWEGTPKQSGNDYIAFDDGYGNVTIGWGIVPKYNKERFKSLGVNPDSITVGSRVSKDIVDKVEQMELESARDSIVSMLSVAGINLESYQIDALISRKYNYNVNGFVQAYKSYGNTQALYNNYMSKPVTASGKYSKGLVRRREAEWELFSNGNYKLNS